MQKKPTLLSGVKPTGHPHIGNYFGAMRQFVDLQEKYNTFIFIADLHSLTSERIQNNPKDLNRFIIDLTKDYLAIGLDPEKTTIYKQSDVPQVTELTWIFNCLLTVPYLQRAHAYKDAEAKGKNINVGTFDYPVLMAADILIMDAEVVPVGKDQQQHVEVARDVVDKFNNLYGNVLKHPEHIIPEEVATVPGTDGAKMSKSYGNTIPLFGTREELTKAVMSIVTDSGSDIPENVYAIHKLIKTEEELAPLYEANKGKYKNLKEALVEDLDTFIAPMREKRASITDEEVLKVLQKGGLKAGDMAEKKMRIVREKIGVALY